jgi:hypothetical protein
VASTPAKEGSYWKEFSFLSFCGAGLPDGFRGVRRRLPIGGRGRGHGLVFPTQHIKATTLGLSAAVADVLPGARGPLRSSSKVSSPSSPVPFIPYWHVLLPPKNQIFSGQGGRSQRTRPRAAAAAGASPRLLLLNPHRRTTPPTRPPALLRIPCDPSLAAKPAPNPLSLRVSRPTRLPCRLVYFVVCGWSSFFLFLVFLVTI